MCSTLNETVFRIINSQLEMERQHWRKVNPTSAERPSPRWGHSCCKIGEDLVFFGGYADSNYMNDLWIFDAASLKWEEVPTLGTPPALRSNCSMSYDAAHARIIIFGGGSSNKTRFNTISILDWNTKTWSQVQAKESEPAPWERTYHAAEFYQDFLVVFGGEGIADLDDLWVYDFRTLVWTEVVLPTDSPRPCARRFHTSALVGDEMFVVAGCHSKYRCLHDIYSLDLAPLRLTRDPHTLKWRQRKTLEGSFLTRWGHSTAVFDSKIYIFGGRFGGDLNDILVFDPSSDTLRTFKIASKLLPSPRRRHCAAFLGSNMLVFGGFNGQYFNDLHYINVYESSIRIPAKQKCVMEPLTESKLADRFITTIDNKRVNIHSGLLSNSFKSQARLDSFIEELSEMTQEEARQLVQSKREGILTPPFMDVLAQKPLKRNKAVGTVIISDDQFHTLLDKRRNHYYSDATVMVGGQMIAVNKVQLSLHCPFFLNAFKSGYSPTTVHMPVECPILFEIVLLYLQYLTLIVPSSLTHKSWMKLYVLADYLTLTRLSFICEAQIGARINDHTLKEITAFSTLHSLNDLTFKCLDHQMRDLYHKAPLSHQLQTYFLHNQQNNPKRIAHYNLHKFDLLNLEREKNLKTMGDTNIKGHHTVEEEKQNRQVTNH